MSDPIVSPQPTLTGHDRAAAQSIELTGDGERSERTQKAAGRFSIGPRVTRPQEIRAYQRDPDNDPIYRNLRIYTRDPTTSSQEGAVATLKIPYEPLPEAGPKGAIFHIVEHEQDRRGREVKLDEPRILIADGLEPSPANPQFHQQMVYAVCMSVYSAFRTALGRHVAWGFESGNRSGTEMQLRINPHVSGMRNAFYNRDSGELRFGYYRATEEDVSTGYLPGLYYTCLSHDIVVHEVTHALLDGLRAHFMQPTSLEVLAFHEAFADIVAILQHFSYDEMLRSALRESRANLSHSNVLANLATEFGHTTKRKGPLRDARGLKTAIDVPTEQAQPIRYDPRSQDRYALGSVLVSAIFDAFTTVYRRKTARVIRLATAGSGVIPPGELPADLMDALAHEASRLASQFLRICIRAIDYCPPVDIRFGDYLRALVTADFNLVPDDPFGYREALVDAFRMRGIFPDGVNHLSQDELRWRGPERKFKPIESLDFAHLQFQGDPQNAASADELRRQARDLAGFITRPEVMDEFGLIAPSEDVDPPCIESIRSSRRVGPDGQILFDLVAEVTQRRYVTDEGRRSEFYGGSTIIIDPQGVVRYVISKSIRHAGRINRHSAFLADTRSAGFWSEREGTWRPASDVFRILDDGTCPD